MDFSCPDTIMWSVLRGQKQRDDFIFGEIDNAAKRASSDGCARRNPRYHSLTDLPFSLDKYGSAAN
jgi:hypothetical protein